jgi:DNA repair protein RadC
VSPSHRPPHPPAVERLAALGPEALSPEELLAVLLAPGGRSATAEREARRLLERFGGLRRLSAAGTGELRAWAPLPDGLALRLVAAFALGRHVQSARLEVGRVLSGSGEIYDAFQGRLRDLKKERFLSVLLDGRQRVMREDLISEGILTASLVHPREVFAPAIREAACSLLLVHNHPSGDPEPSPEDLEITRRLVAAGELVGIRVVDHVVIGEGCYVSFLERGLIP